MSNQKCKIRKKIVDSNKNEPTCYTFSISIKKCSGSCNNINDPYAKLCVPDVVKNINVKAFNVMSWSNQLRHIEWHESCKCKCRLDASVCDEGFIWNPSGCNYEYDN